VAGLPLRSRELRLAIAALGVLGRGAPRPVSQSAWSGWTGLEQAGVSRGLGRLRKAGVIEVEGRSLYRLGAMFEGPEADGPESAERSEGGPAEGAPAAGDEDAPWITGKVSREWLLREAGEMYQRARLVMSSGEAGATAIQGAARALETLVREATGMPTAEKDEYDFDRLERGELQELERLLTKAAGPQARPGL
jgi:hypothetical protein